MPHDYLQIATTTESKDDAARIAAALVERRLAACVHVVGPIASTFGWEGRIDTAEEWQCVAKTRRDLYPMVEQAIRELHSYEVPEIIATPIVAGSRAYLDWIDGAVLPKAAEDK